MSSLLERDYPWWLMEKEKEILPVRENGGRLSAGSLKPLDIKLTLMWHSVRRQGCRTQIGKGLIRGLVKPPEGILLLSLAPSILLRKLGRTRLSSLTPSTELLDNNRREKHLGLRFQGPIGLAPKRTENLVEWPARDCFCLGFAGRCPGSRVVC